MRTEDEPVGEGLIARNSAATDPSMRGSQAANLQATAKKTRTKDDLIREVSLLCELPVKQASIAVDSIFTSIIDALRSGDRVELRRFGVFRPHTRGARRGRDPRSGAEVKVPPKSVARFQPSKHLRDFLDKVAEKSKA